MARDDLYKLRKNSKMNHQNTNYNITFLKRNKAKRDKKCLLSMKIIYNLYTSI